MALNQDETQANSWDVILQLSRVAAVPERSPSRYAKDRRSAGPLTTLIVGCGNTAQLPALIMISDVTAR